MKKSVQALVLLCCLSGIAQAADYSFPEVNVTALREQESNLQTPADVSVITGEELEQTGEENIAAALSYLPGVVVSRMGPHDQSWITGNTDVILRGVAGGTLVLLNGIPVSFNGVSHLDAIPTDAVERVEVVKGGGSVLYGSGAYGGVINVITKKTGSNFLRLRSGNVERMAQAGVSTDRIGVHYTQSRYDEVKRASGDAGTRTYGTEKVPFYFGFGDSRKDALLLQYNWNEDTFATYLHTQKRYSILYKTDMHDIGEIAHFDYWDKEDFLSINHQQGRWQGSVYAQRRDIHNPDYYTNHPEKIEWEKSRHYVYGTDIRYVREGAMMSQIIGVSARQETYRNDRQKFSQFGTSESPLRPVENSPKYRFSSYSIYGQHRQKFNDRLQGIASFRYETVDANQQRIHQLLPQAQLVYAVSDTQSVYVQAGRSFRMPTFRNLFYSSGALAPNPDLKPEYGRNAEIGWKLQDKGQELRVVAFDLELRDQFASRKIADGRSQTYNAARYKNRGIEVSYKRYLNDNWLVGVGAMWGDPKRQDNAGSAWKRVVGTKQYAGYIAYEADKINGRLDVVYYGGRVYPNQSNKSSLLITNLHILGKVDKSWEWDFSVDNILNRKDILNSDSSATDFYVPERSYRIGVTYRFD